MNRFVSRLFIVACAVAIVLVCVSRATAAVRPHLASGSAQFTSPTAFVGTGIATHLGAYTEAGSVAFFPTSDPAVLQVVGSTDYTAANGAVLHALIAGQLNVVTGAVTATLTYAGGTGRFADASGSANLVGQLLPGGSITVTVSGSVDF